MKKIMLLFGCIFALQICIAEAARYNNALPSCESLGYVRLRNARECQQPVYCPFDTSYAVCISEKCRGFVSREKFEAANGDRCEVETCVQGEGNSAHTLYRCKECRGAFQAGRCLTECSIADFPYSSPPPDLYGTYLSCKDMTGMHYGYTECYNGWEKKGARCDMAIADRKAYPYSDIETHEPRGILKDFQSATNTYYGFSSCNSGYELKTSGSLDTGLCIKQCEISNCREIGEVEGIKDYKCDIPEDCIPGDTMTFGGKEIGILLHKVENDNDHNLIVNECKTGISFGMYGGQLSSLGNDDGKCNTAKILEYCQANNYDCPAAQYCHDYSISGVTELALAKGQWFLPSKHEAHNWLNNEYMHYFAILYQFSILDTRNILVSKDYNKESAYVWRFKSFDYSPSSASKTSTNYYVCPMLAI